MPRRHTPMHLLPQSAEGAVGACLAIGRELVASAPTTFLLGAHRPAQASLVAVDHEGSRPTRMVLDLFPNREVGLPAVIRVPHVVVPPSPRYSRSARSGQARLSLCPPNAGVSAAARPARGRPHALVRRRLR